MQISEQFTVVIGNYDSVKTLVLDYDEDDLVLKTQFARRSTVS